MAQTCAGKVKKAIFKSEESYLPVKVIENILFLLEGMHASDMQVEKCVQKILSRYIECAIASGRSGDNSPSVASRLFNIPRKTFPDHVKTQRRHISSGKPTVVTAIQEVKFSKRIVYNICLVYLEKRGFPCLFRPFGGSL